MTFATLTKKEIVAILKKIENIASLLKDVNEILNSETKDPSEPEENVLHIIPGVIVQFERNQKNKMSVIDVITLYENWTKHLYEATISNKGHMQNKHLRKHMAMIYGMCRSVEEILKSVINYER